MPTNRQPGIRLFSAAIKWAPRKSPDASPATMAMTFVLSDRLLAIFGTEISADDPAIARLQELRKDCQFRDDLLPFKQFLTSSIKR